MDWALSHLREGNSLDMEQMIDVLDSIMSGECSDSSIVELLTLLHDKGETTEELAGAARALQQKMTVLNCDRPHLIDTCGTGGSGKNTFNISTASAIVAAAAGAAVAKHGNRAITGKSGSADVLQSLGVNIDCSFETTEVCLNELGICFCFAPLFHPSVRHASAARKQLTFPTIFNLLGPLCNPARAPYQLLGAGRGETQRLLAEALCKLGTQKSAVVHGCDGIGEVTIGGSTKAIIIDGSEVEETSWDVDDFPVQHSELSALQVNEPEQSAKLIRGVLDNEPGPALEVVVANSAAALWLVGLADDLKTGTNRSRQVIADGTASQLLEQLVAKTNS